MIIVFFIQMRQALILTVIFVFNFLLVILIAFTSFFFYQICVWCWHRILNEANSGGCCLACRSPYDEEKIVGMAAICGRLCMAD